MKERLQKILARTGYGSRRAAEGVITAGRVRVNGAVAIELGTQADPDVDRIEVDGKRIELTFDRVYLAMFKPPGVVTTVSDPGGRPTVMSLLPPGTLPHVLSIGRLDLDSEGLLLFTNDGEFAHRLSHPRYEVEKEYYAMIVGAPTEEAIERLRRGVEIEGQMTSAARIEVARAPIGYQTRDGHTWLRLVIHEGRKRQVRLMTAAVGHQVRTLVRVRVGDVVLGRMTPGTTRRLTKREVDSLSRAVGL